MDPEGDAVALWSTRGGNAIRAALRSAEGHWQPAVDAPAVPDVTDLAMAMDAAGRGLAVWQSDSGRSIGGAELKPDGPVLDRVAIPKRTRAGIATRFSVTALPWGSATLAGKPSWNFGDGRTATGATPRHVFRSAGTYPVTVSATDSLGGTSTAGGTVIVVKKKRR
jgi:hypothetical protein